MSERKKPTSQPPPVSPPRTITPPEDAKPQRHPIGTPRGLSTSSGVMAVGAWLAERGIFPPQGKAWRIEITLDVTVHTPMRVFAETIDTRFRITILPDEWRYYFCHAGRVSSVRVTDQPRVDTRDEHNLVTATPTLKRIGTLVRQLEQRFSVSLARHHASIETTLPGVEPMVRAWAMSL